MAKIPVNLTPLPVPVGVQAMNINQLFQLWSQFVEASIDVANVSFFVTGTVDPQSDQGLFFNTAQNQFKVWNTTLGKYVPISDLQVGDTKLTFVTGDDVNEGWLVCDGRNVQNITGISQTQRQTLEVLFGENGNIPSLAAPTTLSNLPDNNVIRNIPVPDINPADGAIESLPISDFYTPAEVKALRDNTETLRDSTSGLATSTKALRDYTEQIRDALGATAETQNAVWKIFVGYP